jgi:hypothetical protein
LLRKLDETPALLELAVNPLLLTMISSIHFVEKTLPKKRVELYAKACEVFVESRQQAKDISARLTAREIQSVLQHLAYHLMQSKNSEISLAEAHTVIAEPLSRLPVQMTSPEFLKLVEDSSGLFLNLGNEHYAFAHLTFQEYLAAVHIKERGLEQELLIKLSSEEWRETIRLYVAQADANNIIQACLAAQPPSADVLSLALDCLEEAKDLQQDQRDQVQALLKQGVEDPDPQRAKVVAEALLKRRLRRQMTIRLDEDCYMAESLITCAEYQLFLDEQRTKGKWFQPDHWLSEKFPKGTGHDPVLGIRSSDAAAFCDWLTTREGGGWRYRLPRAGELAQAQRDQAFEATTPRGVGYWREDGLEYLGYAQAQRFLTGEMLDKQIAEDLARTPTLNLNLARARTHARTFERILNFAGNSALERVLSLAPVSALESPNDLSRARMRVHTLALDPALRREQKRRLGDISNVRALARALALVRSRVLDLIHIRNRSHDLSLAHDFDLANDQITTAEAATRVLYSLIRVTALVIAEPSLREVEHLWAGQGRNRRFLFFGKARHTDEDSLRKSADAYLDLYVDFAMLEARIKGELQPFEGILIVKERVPDGQAV